MHNIDLFRNQIIDSIRQRVIGCDTSGKVVYANAAALGDNENIISDDAVFNSILESCKINKAQLSASEGEANIKAGQNEIPVEFAMRPKEVGNDTFWIFQYADISKRVEAEEKLRESEQMLLKIIDLLPHAIFLKDHTRKFVLANKQVADYHDLSVEDIIGKSDEDLFTVEEYKPFIEVEDRILKNRETITIPEEIFADHEGKTRYIHSTKMPFFISGLNEWGILGVNLDFTELKLLEEEKANLKLNHQKTLMNAVVDTQERERKAIAHDLHDGLGQLLTAVKMNLHAYFSSGKTKEDPKYDQLQRAEELLENAIHEVRIITGDLLPSVLSDFGFINAVEKLCSSMEQTSGIEFTFSAHGDQVKLTESIEFNLYRITQEIVNNIVKHSQANEASVQIFQREEELVLQVEDDGVGFDKKLISKSSGLGLKSIENRVNLMNGTLDLDTSPGLGCSYTIILPNYE